MAIKLEQTDIQEKFKEYAGHVLNGGMIFDQENEDAVKKSIDIIDKNQTGLMVIGNPGSGKTLLFEMMQKIIHPQSPNFFIKLNVLDVVMDFNNKSIGHGVFRKWRTQNVFFDDLGTEDIGSFYNEKVDVFEKFIQFRYDLFRSHKIKTHFSTNEDYASIKKRYGTRCVSRLNEMCEIIVMGGNSDSKDRREYKNFLGLPPVLHEMTKNGSGVNYEKYKANQLKYPEVQNGLGQRVKEAWNL